MPMGHQGISVGRRLISLVVIEIICGGGLLALLLLWGVAIERDLSFMGRFALDPIAGISTALEDAASLELLLEARPAAAPARIRMLTTELEQFVNRYHSQWQVAANPSRDAARFRATVLAAGQGSAMEEELQAIADARRQIEAVRAAAPTGPPEAAEELHTALRALLGANVVFMQTAQHDISTMTERARNLLLAVGLVAVALVTTLGLMVHRAIAPRLRRLVNKVEIFREYGAFEREPLEGADEIAVLGHAIDVGFEAIATRERERERFLAIAAHELKTPLTSILGFSQAALENREEPELRRRALDVIRRHASRLGRVIDELLLAAAARSGALSFTPTPIDLSELTRRVLFEVETSLPRHAFELQLSAPLRVLGDEALLAQSLWTLFTYAAAISSPPEPVRVEVVASMTPCRIEVSIAALSILAEDFEKAFTPFAVVQYEGIGGIRSANGLYFCREVAHLHGGHLRLHTHDDRSGAVTLELPQ
jgi:signal transduction histidine kinase